MQVTQSNKTNMSMNITSSIINLFFNTKLTIGPGGPGGPGSCNIKSDSKQLVNCTYCTFVL